jgi:quinol monooxygenase YgiN
MFMRFIQLKINMDYREIIKQFYNDSIIPELQKIDGCLFAGLIQSNRSSDELISMTLWKTKAQAEAFEKSEVFQKLMKRFKPFLSESSEWKIQLSEDLQVQYAPVQEEPVLSEFEVTAQSSKSGGEALENPRMYVRLVSLKLQEDKVDEFRRIYIDQIIPALNAWQGCQYAYLIESLRHRNEIISVTIWENKKDADIYEESGQFSELVDKVKHTFSEFYRWKMALEKSIRGEVKTSEDMKVDYYGLVSVWRYKK